MRNLIKVLLVIIGLISIPYFAFAEGNKDTATIFEVTYFHATMRCQGCIAIENFTVESLETEFAKELKSGKLKYSSLDFLQPENEHFVDEFKIEAQTLIITQKSKGKILKWKNLDKIWDVSDSSENFRKYIKKEVREFMRNSPAEK